MRFLLLIAIFFSVSSCKSPVQKKKPLTSEDSTLRIVADDLHAKDYRVEHHVTTYGNDKKYTIDFTLIDVPLRPGKDYIENNTSAIAFDLYQHLPDSVRKKQSLFQITVENPDDTFYLSYQADVLEWASLMSIIVDGFFAYEAAGGKCELLDQRYFTEADISKIRAVILEKLPGKTKCDYRVISIGKTAGPDLEYCVTYETLVSRNGKTMRADFAVSTKESKIVSLHLY